MYSKVSKYSTVRAVLSWIYQIYTVCVQYSVGRAKFPISAEKYFPLPFLFLSLPFPDSLWLGAGETARQPRARLDSTVGEQLQEEWRVNK